MIMEIIICDPIEKGPFINILKDMLISVKDLKIITLLQIASVYIRTFVLI